MCQLPETLNESMPPYNDCYFPLFNVDSICVVRRLRSDIDAALISLAYDTGARADNLIAFNTGDLVESDGVASIKLRKSKTDQEGRGRSLPVMRDTLERLRGWIETSGLDREPKDSPLFMPLSTKGDGGGVYRVVTLPAFLHVALSPKPQAIQSASGRLRICARRAFLTLTLPMRSVGSPTLCLCDTLNT